MKLDYRTLFSTLMLCFSPAIIGGAITSISVDTWYPTLVKPALNPPNWLFGPVWTVLYFLQALSLYLLLKTKADRTTKLIAYAFFALQLILNLLWSVLFFGLRSPGAGAVGIGLLIIAVIFTLITAFRISRPAALLLLPYLAWISFAAYLNFSIWLLNRGV
jgi:translocator protein